MIVSAGVCAAVLLGFAGARWLSGRLGHPPWASPVLMTALAAAAVLAAANVPLVQFDAATRPLRWLLGPAVVALALVIEGNRQLLRRRGAAILLAVTGGAAVGFGSAVGMARLLGLDSVLAQALSTKTVTAPFVVAIMTATGGPIGLAAALSVLTGVIGALLVPWLFDRLRIGDESARALGLGVSSHIVGTEWLTRRNPRAGGLAALAFVLTGLLAALVVPLIWGSVG
ncbi:membrane protein [Polymorphobacter glacialis]|uniref:Membrane protein n=1 Tax=Sandarakinorhabdus glacialis TaxID=1614636 RepID=A0A917ECA6_9SPHN|nr:LrgB family protein [Polymorphobacter glacialis]GGE18957.1 membrane protein [Polymorphobacter glacialis]